MSLRIQSRWTTALCLLVSLAAFGCTSSTSPSPEEAAAAGTYSLTAISGAAPPVVTIPNGAGGCIGTVDRGTFTLNSDKTYTLELNARFNCPTGPANNLTARETGT